MHLVCIFVSVGFYSIYFFFWKKKNRFYRKELHTIISAEEIKSLKDLPMITFELRVWQKLGQRYVDRADRLMVIIIRLFLLM